MDIRGSVKEEKGKPFLVVYHHKRPAKGQKTELKNFKNDGQWETIEQVKYFDDINKRAIINEATIIIDIFDRKIIKNRYGNDDNVVEHYLSQYKKETAEAIQNWIKRLVQTKPKEAQKLIIELEEKIRTLVDQ